MLQRISYKDQVYQYLKDALVRGELQTGQIYSEQQFADKLAISRTPVREAVIRLTNEGMFEVYSNRGWGVRPVTADDLREIIEARIAVEGYSIRALCHLPTTDWQDTIHELQECQQRSEAFAQDESHHFDYMKADTDFHSVLVACTGNRYLMELNGRMRLHIERATFRSLHRSRRNAMACREHQRILNALEKKDEAQAMQAFSAHMEATAEAIGARL